MHKTKTTKAHPPTVSLEVLRLGVILALERGMSTSQTELALLTSGYDRELVRKAFLPQSPERQES